MPTPTASAFLLGPSMRDFPGYWVDETSGQRYMAFELAPVPLQDAMALEPRCFCEIYRERVWKALKRFQFCRAYRFTYYGAVRMFELDERMDQWDVADVAKRPKKGLLLRMRSGLHALLAPRLFRQAGASLSSPSHPNQAATKPPSIKVKHNGM